MASDKSRSATWTPGDPCPYCGEGPVKFNGGSPLCLGCRNYMPGPPRMTVPAKGDLEARRMALEIKRSQ